MTQNCRSETTASAALIVAIGVLLLSSCRAGEEGHRPRSLARSHSAAEWHHFGGDLGNTKYSSLAQIDRHNVSEIREAWRFDVTEVEASTGHRTRSFRVMPILANGRLFVSTQLNLAAALDPATGDVLWDYDPKAYELPTPTHGGLGNRGVAYWRGEGPRGTLEERIFLATGGLQLVALDAATGETFSDFGNGGIVDLSKGLGRKVARNLYNLKGPVTVCRDTIVVGSIVSDVAKRRENPPGHVRGYDVRTGDLRWIFHTIPQAGELGNETWEEDSWEYTGNTNVWSFMSADEELGLVYLPIGTPTNDWYGGHRLGDNLFAESVVALDCETGTRAWHFQAVHHGVWDYDFPTAANLVDITVDGRSIRALAQVSKQGFAYILDRTTGEPVWPIEEREVPQSSVPGERLSSTQPYPTRPPAFDRQGVTVDDLIDFTPSLRAEAEMLLERYVYGPLFTPPTVAGTNGKEGTIVMPGITGGANWPGAAFDPEHGLLYVKSSTVPWVLAVAPGDERSGLDYAYKDWVKFPEGPQGLPLFKPPYSRITALDLTTGEMRWQVPFGEGPRQAVNEILADGRDVGALGSIRFGAVNSNPLLVTKTLLFANEALEEDGAPGVDAGVLRAFDKATGEIVFERRIASAPNGALITYLHEDKQYLVFSASRPSEEGTKHELVAYALP